MPENDPPAPDARAAFEALRTLEELVLAPRPDPAVAHEAVHRLEAALEGDGDA